MIEPPPVCPEPGRGATGSPAAPLPPPPPGRRWWKTLLIVLGLLLCGGFAGSAITGLVLRRMMVETIQHPERITRHLHERIRHDLKLSDEQSAEVLRILEKHTRSLVDAHRGAMNEVEREVAAVLTPEQAAVWKEKVAKRRETFFRAER